MKNIFLLVIAALIITSCQNDDSSDSSFSMKATGADYTGYPAAVQTVSGDITTNTTWTNDKVWEIDGIVRVKNGATLTIQAGTFIKAKDMPEGYTTGVLVITKTGKIDAQGTANSPIIFTSYNLLDDDITTKAAPGDFGGIVILGDANVNTGSFNNLVEGFYDRPNMSEFYYGGTNNAHNAGILNYVRIEFSGVTMGYETYYTIALSGLTLGGVGSGTSIDHVQVSYSKNDSFEFLGGTVNASHLVGFAAYDDNFKIQLGYRGTITKAVALADINSYHNYSGSAPDSNGIELENNSIGQATTIITRPVISQMSIIGVSTPASANSYEYGIHVRRLGQISLTNVTVTGYNKGIVWESPSVPSTSTWSALSIHGYVNPVLPTTTVLGFGNVVSAVNPGTKWSLTQPFFNDGPLDFTGATGAFKTEALWTNTWTKFVNF